MKANDTSVETTELVLKVIDYAHEHKLDTSKIDNVKKILKVVDPTPRSESEIREFMVLLKVTQGYFELKAPEEKDIKKKLPN